jgi:hypothetical protein
MCCLQELAQLDISTIRKSRLTERVGKLRKQADTEARAQEKALAQQVSALLFFACFLVTL